MQVGVPNPNVMEVQKVLEKPAVERSVLEESTDGGGAGKTPQCPGPPHCSPHPIKAVMHSAGTV